MLVVTLLVISAFIFLLQYHWRRRQIYRLAMQLPGPPAFPLIGNPIFLCAPEDMLGILQNMVDNYTKPLRLWFGQDLVIYFSYSQHIEKILSSTKLVHKHHLYDLFKVYLGDGLVTSSGEKYKKQRRLIQPLLDLKFVSGNIEAFQRHTNILFTKLEAHVDKGTFDIQHSIHGCFTDVVGESLLGMQMNAQHGKNMDYIQASLDMYNVGFNRIMKPWLHPDLIYRFTKGKTEQTRIVNVTTKFIENAISKAWLRKTTQKENNSFTENSVIPIIDQVINSIEKNPKCMDDTEFVYHMLTLYAASEDTMTLICSVLCVCLGMYPEYQKIAANEIRSICGSTPREVTYEDVMKLQYLDMCVRDVLRLIPIAPIIMRKTLEDFQIDDYTIPKGCGILVSLFEVHRDPKHWENPEHFYPNHFLPEFVKKRHPYAYVPFSAGPRGCVGKLFAVFGLKVLMANILQRFEIEADQKLPDLRLRTDISVRLRDGYNVRLRKRIWT